MDGNTELSDITQFTGLLADGLNRGINEEQRNVSYIETHIDLWDTRIQQLDVAYDRGEYIGDMKTHKIIIHATKQEYNTWLLLRNLRLVEDMIALPSYNNPVDGAITRRADFEEQYSMTRVIERIVQTRPDLLRYQSVINWLESIAPEPTVTHTDLLFKHSLNRFSELHLTSPDTTSTLDPDTPFRKFGRSVLHSVDIEDELTMLSYVFKYIRSGHIDSAADVCRTFQQQWRAASILGSVPHHTVLNQNDPLFGTTTGTERYFLWKAQCRSIASNPNVSPIEAAVYGSLCGQEAAVLTQSHTWMDACWARMKTSLTLHIDSTLYDELKAQEPDCNTVDNTVVDALTSTNSASLFAGLEDIADDLSDLRASSFMSMLTVDSVVHKNSYLTGGSEHSSSIDIPQMLQLLRRSYALPTDIPVSELTQQLHGSPLQALQTLTNGWTQVLCELFIAGEYGLVEQEAARHVALVKTMLASARRFSTQQREGQTYIVTLQHLLRSYLSLVVHIVIGLQPTVPYTDCLSDLAVSLVQEYLSVLYTDQGAYPCIPVYVQLLPTQQLIDTYSRFLLSLPDVETQKLYISEAGNYQMLQINLLPITKATVHDAIVDNTHDTTRDRDTVTRSLLFTPAGAKRSSFATPGTGNRLGRIGISETSLDSDAEDEEEKEFHERKTGFSLFTPTPSKVKRNVLSHTPARSQEIQDSSSYESTHHDLHSWVDTLTNTHNESTTIDANNISCCALSLSELESLVPPVHAHKIASLSCLCIDPDDPTQITQNPHNLLEAALYSNGLIRAFMVAQSLPSARSLAAHCDDLVTTVEDLFGHDMAMLVQPTEAIKQLQALQDDAAHGLLDVDTSDKRWLLAEAEGIEARGNAGREMIAWRYYLTCLVWFQAFASLVRSKPEPCSRVSDVEYNSLPSTEHARIVETHQQQLVQWTIQLKNTATSLFEAFKRTLLFPGGWLQDILLDTTTLFNGEMQRSTLHPLREAELDTVRKQAIPQLCFMLMYVADTLGVVITPEECTTRFTPEINHKAVYWNMNLGISLSRALTELIVDDNYNLHTSLTSLQLKQMLQLAVGLEARVSLCPHQAV